MIVLGADAHKRSHTIAAVAAATGELMGEQTVQVGAKSFGALVLWARELGSERVWALEDCRHVSGSFERFLVERGERVVRVTSKLMADARRRARGRGKSDRIDAIAVARAALREELDALPAAQLEGPELDLRLLVDHRERLVCQRVAINNTLQWHLHDLWPELQLPGSSLFYGNWGPRVARRLARTEQTMRVRIARDELRRICELTQTIKTLEAEITELVAQIAPQLLSEPGLGPLTAAKLVGEIAGVGRFATDAKLARAAGVAPIPVSSGKTTATASTAAATARSTRPSTASPSPACAATPKPRTTSPANAPKARAPKKPSAASSATSPAASGTCSSTPPHPDQDNPTHQLLDIGAAKRAARRSRGLRIPQAQVAWELLGVRPPEDAFGRGAHRKVAARSIRELEGE
ncbi:MAG: IS110 family RNA-guided transposase [Solirubrobacteraceae bacterium]